MTHHHFLSSANERAQPSIQIFSMEFDAEIENPDFAFRMFFNFYEFFFINF